jgi:hypothetical protein
MAMCVPAPVHTPRQQRPPASCCYWAVTATVRAAAVVAAVCTAAATVGFATTREPIPLISISISFVAFVSVRTSAICLVLIHPRWGEISDLCTDTSTIKKTHTQYGIVYLGTPYLVLAGISTTLPLSPSSTHTHKTLTHTLPCTHRFAHPNSPATAVKVGDCCSSFVTWLFRFMV